MSSYRYFYSVSHRTRRFLTVVSLTAYLASVMGYPLPLAAKHDHAVAYPCQDHRCGCTSAEQCWTSCCCFTPAERIAWARKHEVTIPAQVRLALEAEEHAHHEHDLVCHADDACEANETAHKHGTCCDHHDYQSAGAERACATCLPQVTEMPQEPGTSFGWVSAFEARKCRGLSTLWIVTGAAVPLAVESLWEFDWAPAGEVSSAGRSLQSVTSLPSVPPPRA